MAIEDKSGRRPGSAENLAAVEALRASEERYRILFESIDQGFCVIEVLFDDAGNPVDYRFLETNPAFEHHTHLYDVEGQRLRFLVPRHEDHWFETNGRVAQTGRPVRFINHGRWLDVFSFRVGQPEERKVAVLFSDITGRKLAEDALRELLLNVVKHAGVSEAEVRMGVRDDPQLGEGYRIEVIDGGAGFDVAAVLGPGARPDGRGLRRLRERLRLVGGRLEVHSDTRERHAHHPDRPGAPRRAQRPGLAVGGGISR